ncbi:hypothetical protein FRX94_08945 [Corynebacterium canis]|uniref:VCBS repeat-containing protein n=1 Tax=Corynebacterium canis TaxID=679663 RepID=A0A5C5UFB7_9CORY|nr:hypothetical protein [Corynebacterium canis]TWT24170.1 hypothetical protein FRX94_08945 [Corynebacterium canis]WJY73983.1 hypothetical protein CCANI_00595 [Corynebacterium canis]
MTNPMDSAANKFTSGNPEDLAAEQGAVGASGNPQHEVELDDPSGSVRNSVSSRDVNADGSIDVVHSVVDGEQNVSYLSAEGEVILTDVDADRDGIFETARITTADNVVVEGTDLDNDSDVDLISYADGRTGTVFQEDSIVDGTVASSRMDFDGDGATDIELVDQNLDGHMELAAVDFDGDGDADVIYRDINNDGTFDYASYDSDGDGVMDTNIDANDYGASGLGDAAAYAELGHYESQEADTQFEIGADPMDDDPVI